MTTLADTHPTPFSRGGPPSDASRGSSSASSRSSASSFSGVSGEPGAGVPADTTDDTTDGLDGRLEAALAGATAGDPAAFAELWRALHPLVLRYLRVVCGDAAEDVASETWLQVSRDLARFSGGTTAFRVWLFRIARNRGIDENRRAWRRREKPHETVHELGEAAGETVPDAAIDAGDRAGTEWALRMIGTLPTEQAEAVMLRVVAGLDVAGTARVLCKRPGAVRIATMRGLRRLAEHPEVQAHRGTGPREGS